MILAYATLIATLGTAVAAVIAAWKINSVAKVATEIKGQADVIAVHVNSAADAARAKIEEKQKELDAAHQIIADQKEAAALLAQLKSIMATKAPPDTGP